MLPIVAYIPCYSARRNVPTRYQYPVRLAMFLLLGMGWSAGVCVRVP